MNAGTSRNLCPGGPDLSDQDQTVDTVPPAPKLLALALQHVLVMYAGAVAVPLIIGRALRLSPEQVALLVNADLFACGIATLIQSLGLGPFGIRLPVMMGVTFAAVSPMVAMAGDPNLGLLGDRKSTRLNSSHANISYAVFCLKKKNKNI